MEVTQFTYFQQMCGYELNPVSLEQTYGLERLAQFIQRKNSIYDLQWSNGVTYGDVRHREEVEFSKYNFELADTSLLFTEFEAHEKECLRLLAAGVALPAYDHTLKCSHLFNLLDARRAIGVSQRAHYIARIRKLARGCAAVYLGESAAPS
jgi:glycyl-tRNA synthetase alpha chain